MMKRVACYHCVSRIARMLVREEPRVNGFDSALAKSRDHRSRHVYRDDPPNIGSDGQRELARARSKIDDGALGTNSHPLELPDVLRPIGWRLPVVLGHVRRIEVFEPGVSELVQHPFWLRSALLHPWPGRHSHCARRADRLPP